MKFLMKQKNNGFTIVETLVAIFILLVSITGPLAIAQSGLRAAYLARDQTTAFYLAQDALEAIKNKRDDNFINFDGGTLDWLDGLDDCIDTLGNRLCKIDTTTDPLEVSSLNSCSEEDCADGILEIDSLGFFNYDGEEDSKFWRKINIQEIETNQEVQVTVTVGWIAEGGTPKTVVAKENILRWAPLYD